jgi:hypothetical protein
MRFTATVAEMRLFGPILLTFLLTSCFGGSCSDSVSAGPISMCISNLWEQVPEETLREEGVPEETLAAFQLKEQRAGQRDNIVVTEEHLPSPVSSKVYADINVQAVAATDEYLLIENRDVEIGGTETILHIFTAKPVPDLPARRFYQVSISKGMKGYVITGTLPFTVDSTVEDGLIEMIMSGKVN